jgi:uroporphyrin-III C-methyltransferase/precorrin-2 dehydrogenase/sirohydrochlorin ferrochelatase
MKYFPVFLDGTKINAIVIGGGDVAARKIELLLKATSKITVLSSSFSSGVQRLIDDNQLTQLNQPYQVGCLANKNLVIAATDDDGVNLAIYKEASAANILLNVVDQPELCSYITPAIIDRSPILIALSSSGSAPVLLRMLRAQIEKTLPSGYGKLAEFSFKFREHVKARVKGLRNRRLFWERTLTGSIGNDILSGKTTRAEQCLIASLKKPLAPPLGEIVFIHTRDGSPDDLTLSAHRAMQYAEAVFYDQDINIDLIEYVRRDANKYPQSVSSSILLNFQHAIELAEQGQKVIYLLPGHTELPDNAALEMSTVNKQVIISGG